jgi:hypothetical protein
MASLLHKSLFAAVSALGTVSSAVSAHGGGTETRYAEPEPTIIEQLLNDPVMLGGSAVVLLVLIGAGYLLNNRCGTDEGVENGGESDSNVDGEGDVDAG